MLALLQEATPVPSNPAEWGLFGFTVLLMLALAKVTYAEMGGRRLDEHTAREKAEGRVDTLLLDARKMEEAVAQLVSTVKEQTAAQQKTQEVVLSNSRDLKQVAVRVDDLSRRLDDALPRHGPSG